MKKNKFLIALLLFACSAFSFGQKGKNNNLTVTTEVAIPYTIANGYFVKNTYKGDSFPKGKITSRKEFESIFNPAAVMGPNGMPTLINFKTHYVIAVIEKTSEYLKTLTPVSLISDGKNIVFNSNLVIGEKLTAQTSSSLIIVVDKKYKGKVITHVASVSALDHVPAPSFTSNTTWVIKQFNSPKRAVTAKNCTLVIDEKGGVFSGNDGCNNFHGPLKLKGSTISLEDGIIGQVACLDVDMAQGNAFRENTSVVNRYEIKGNDLLLYKDKTLIMTLEKSN